MKQIRLILWIAVAAAAIAIGAFLLEMPNRIQAQPQPVSTLSHFGGPFTLIDGDDKPFSSAELAGKPYALYFGYTRCPDVCPTTLNRLVHLRRQLGLGADSFNIVFVTVDPDRDGPTQVGSYAKAFGAPIIGLTGSDAQIDKVKKEYGIYSKKVPDGSGDYTVDHTAVVLLFDRNGKYQATIAPDEGDNVALDKLRMVARA